MTNLAAIPVVSKPFSSHSVHSHTSANFPLSLSPLKSESQGCARPTSTLLATENVTIMCWKKCENKRDNVWNEKKKCDFLNQIIKCCQFWFPAITIDNKLSKGQNYVWPGQQSYPRKTHLQISPAPWLPIQGSAESGPHYGALFPKA